MQEQEVTKIEFEIKVENNSRVSDLKFEVKVNGKPINDYTYESINIYKVNSNIASVCDLKTTQTKLSNNYILKDSETYAIEIEELKINNMEIGSAIGQVDNTTFVNGFAIENLEKYCIGSKYEEGTSKSFRFILSESEIKNNTMEIIGQNQKNINDNNFYIPIFICAICVFIIVIIILLYRNKTKRENI